MFSPVPTPREADQFAPSYVSRHAISIIVPTLNEAENIGGVLADIVDSVGQNYAFEILITDGGSTDGTCEQVSDWATMYPVSLVKNTGAGGLANDVMAAALKARYPVLVVMDADGSHPASSIGDLVDPVLTGDYDMVVGSRYVDGGTTIGWPLHRRALSRFGAALASPFTNIADPMSGFFAIRRADLIASGERAEGFKIGLEAVFAGGDTLKVLEVPIAFADRTLGKSKLGVGHFTAYFGQLARFCGVSPSSAFKRFVVVGMAGVALDFVVVWIALFIGVDPTIANISGFCCASAFNYMAHAEWTFEGRPKTHSQIARYLLVLVLALAMRGGFIAAATDLGFPVGMVILVGIAGGGMVSYFGSEFFVFRDNASFHSTGRWKLTAIAVLAYVAILRVVYQGSIDLLPQEAYYWTYAQHPALGYLDHPPIVAWLIGIGTSVFGDSEFGVRIAATLSWLVTAYFVSRLTFSLYGRTAAFIALLLLSILPFFFAVGVLMTPDAPLTAAWAGALHFLERALIGKRNKAWIGVGICIGIGMLSKYTIGLLGLGTVIFLLLHPGSRRWFFSPWPYAGALIAVVLFSPVIVWNATNDWASFEFQGTRRWVSEEIELSLHLLAGYIAMLVGPLGLALIAVAANKLVRRQEGHDRIVFVSVFTLVPLYVFAVFSLVHMVKMNWTGPLWLASLPMMANVFAAIGSDNRLRRLNSLLKVGVVASVVLFSLALHYLALGFPAVGYTGSLRDLPVAWEEFGREARQIRDDVAAKSGVSPLLVGMDRYNIASILGFYATDRTAPDNVTSQNLFGKNGLMFGVWHPGPREKKDVVVMYSLTQDRLSDAEIGYRFDRLGPLETRFVYKGRTEAGRFFYRIGYGLRPATADWRKMDITEAATDQP